MLSDILLIILGLYAISTPYWLIKAVKFGLKCAEKPEEAIEEPVFTLPEINPKHDESEMTEDMKEDLAILANINAYDGTSAGQREII